MLRKICNCLAYIKCIAQYIAAEAAGLFVKNRPKYKNLWLISERKQDARDNGYHFFKYLCENHKEINCAFVIDRKSCDYDKVRKLGRVIQPGSLEHHIAFAVSTAKISTHLMGPAPDTYRFAVLDRYFNLVKGKKIILRHGIAGVTLSELIYPRARADLLVCSAVPEYEDFVKHYNYPPGVVQRLGLCRYDRLLSPHTVKRQILIMPTWRYYLRVLSNKEFMQSDYYKNFNGLITNRRLLDLLEKYDYEVKFYLHFELQPYSELFEELSERVHVMKMGTADVQNLLMESAMLITDFSSVYFDFAYMDKPLLYWQFDEDKYYETQYGKGYFSCREDGFGPVVDDNDVEKVVDFIELELKSDMCRQHIYGERTDRFFKERTNNHCEKTYNAISEILKK